jgi:hypothetical protein
VGPGGDAAFELDGDAAFELDGDAAFELTPPPADSTATRGPAGSP